VTATVLNLPDRVQRIIDLESKGDEHQWEAARLIWEELDEGIRSQRDLGEAIGKSQQHVGRMAKVWELWITDTLGSERPPFCEVYRDLKGESDYEKRRSSVSNEWYTPAEYLEAARRVLGAIDLDPASCELANKTVQAAGYYTEDDDGLNQPWKGRVWLNPPYGGQAGAFVTKLAESYDSGEVTAAIALITALTTDTNWFRPLWDHVLCFFYGRIKFDSDDGSGSSNTAGSIFIYLGPDPDGFQAEFGRFGAVVVRRRP
jgi:phage N-6-adenine-methyltransferase